ncbi:MAG TPA: UDP pyrophosphate phosphatase [Firmicutes bacterium]|nr:UDP pyrophosphate phosphatase [Bacillota bacterium]
MDWIIALKYLLLGFVQGLAEILPISSSGHLALLQYLLNVNTDQEALFAIFVHFASLLALSIFFFKTIVSIIKGFFISIFKQDPRYKNEFWMGIYIVVASIPAALIGFLLEDLVAGLFGDLLFVGIGFLVTATILFLWPLIGNNQDETVSWKHVLTAGLFQAIGILPGVSRSGITITGAKLSGLKEEPAKKFAFLLFIPIALGSFVLSLGDISLIVDTETSFLVYFSLAMVAAFIFTYLALLFIFKKFHYSQAKYFAIYLVAIGTLTIILSFI